MLLFPSFMLVSQHSFSLIIQAVLTFKSVLTFENKEHKFKIERKKDPMLSVSQLLQF